MYITSLFIFSWIIIIDFSVPKEEPQLLFHGPKSCRHFDNYFNRLFMLTYAGRTVTTAVFIDSTRCITSFNPFRMLSRDKGSKNDVYALIYTSKTVENGIIYYDFVYNLQLKCARQIIPVKETSLKADQWHGADRKHSPVHDIMVFRLSNSTNFLTIVEEFDWKDTAYHRVGPLKAELAGPGDELGATVKIGAIGVEHTVRRWDWMTICSVEYETGDVLLDCDEWLPRNWGHFICINNQDNWIYMKSGAFLVSDDKVFGIGSFLISRGKRGILAFTDVRPYQPLINRTCTVDDQNLKDPTQNSSNASTNSS